MARKGTELVDVKYTRIKIDSPRQQAVLFVVGGKDVWLPRSQIEVDPDARIVTMPVWLAEEKEIDGEVV